MWKAYFNLIKPGIIFGNLITAISGFFIGSKGPFDEKKFLFMALGLSLIIGSSCVMNNYFDRRIDQEMKRTQNRPFVTRHISSVKGISYAICLLIIGSFLLFSEVNLLALTAGLIGFFIYVFIYTPLKKRSIYSTMIGSVAGSMPPLVGYLAASDQLDQMAILLFLFVAFWQMPHFYAIALYRKDEYEAAKIPTLPIVKGVYRTKIEMIIFTALFFIVSLSFYFFGYNSYFYLGLALSLGSLWLKIAYEGFFQKEEGMWAKKMFRMSLIILMILSIVIPIDQKFFNY